MKKIYLFTLIFFISITSNLFARSEQIELTYLDGSKIKLWMDIYKTNKSTAPTVIVMHGCGGISNDHHFWGKSIQSWGFNSIVLDSFSGVANGDVCSKPSLSTPHQRAQQAYSLAGWIEKQEWSDKKIGIIGFSHGGWTTLIASTKELSSLYPNNKIVTAVAFYPHCDNYFIRTHKRKIPLQIHIGDLDTWTPSFPCEATAEVWDLKDNFYLYKDQHHHFDRLSINTITDGYKISRSDPVARELSMKRTKEFFEKTLK
jgi:dienelactone hydrolase